MTEPPDWWDSLPTPPEDDGLEPDIRPIPGWMADAADEVIDFMLDSGLDNESSIVFDIGAVEDPSTIRGFVGRSIGEVLNYLFNAGVLFFSQVVYRDDEEGNREYLPVVPHRTP